jgi:hypothetical protein
MADPSSDQAPVLPAPQVARGIRLLRLRLAGVTMPYEVDFRRPDGTLQPLSVISGPTNTGKTSVLQLAAYALGGTHYPDHEEIVRQVRAVVLETAMPSGIATIERALESKIALVFDLSLDRLGETVPVPHPVEPAGDPASLSKYLLSTVDLQDIQLREAPTQEQSETDPLSFRDLMWLCMILNERVGSTQLLFEGNYNKNLKLLQVVDAVFGVHENESADRARRISQRDAELAGARREVASLENFVREQDATPREELQHAAEEADAELGAVRVALSRLDVDESAAVGVAADLRIRHVRAGRQSAQARQRVRDREAMVSRYASLRAQYSDDIRKLTLLKQAGSVFDQLSVQVCPACLGGLPERPRVQDCICTMCNQPIPTVISSLTLGSAAVARETPVAGLRNQHPEDAVASSSGSPHPVDFGIPDYSGDPLDEGIAQRVIQSELNSTRRRFNELNDYWLQLDDSLPALRAAATRASETEAALAAEIDRAAAGKVTPYVSARESLLARRQAAMVRRDRVNAGLKNWRSVDSRQRRVDRLAGELAELRREQREHRTRPDRQAMISALSSRFRKILSEWGYPKHEETGVIDDKLVPYARTRPYRSASSGGQVLQTLAWMLSVFEVAYEQQAHHPGFLLIDTPQKNLGGAAAADDEEFADVRLVERFYRHIIGWLDRDGRGAQVIVVDNTPPPVAAQYVVRHYTRDPDHGVYGLIDNEKG